MRMRTIEGILIGSTVAGLGLVGVLRLKDIEKHGPSQPHVVVGVIAEPPVLREEFNPDDGENAPKFNAYVAGLDGKCYHFGRFQSARDYFDAYTMGDTVAITVPESKRCPHRPGYTDAIYATLDRYSSKRQ